MRVLVTGSNGQLGRTILARQPGELSIVGVDKDDLDIADAAAVNALIAREKPDVIVNTAAYTAVDIAESDEAAAHAVNVDGARNLAATGVRLIHVSTDFVFDGAATSPYGPDHETNPLGVYGRSKRDGENEVRALLPDRSIILRTAWLYSEYGGNFVDTMLRLMNEREELSVVDDQVGSPTWTRSVAAAIFAFIARPAINGIYHWTDGGQASWHEFACAIRDEARGTGLLEKNVSVRPISSSDFAAAAERPAYSLLD